MLIAHPYEEALEYYMENLQEEVGDDDLEEIDVDLE